MIALINIEKCVELACLFPRTHVNGITTSI